MGVRNIGNKMGKITTSQVYYKIQERIGEGLTSEVYRAFRSDSRGWTRQEVALKIIKSKKNIQLLKKEFEQLLKIRSKYCVQIIAWESLPQGPALVLEFLNGLTLEKIHGRGSLTKDLTCEILAQTSLGLKALHRQGSVHGDLNLKNIMVTRNGIVKLIDFGFFQSRGETWVTPRWASPRVLKGAVPKPQDDFYSLSQLEKFLLSSNTDKKEFLEFCQKKETGSGCQYGQSKAARRRSLARMVRSFISHKIPDTQIIHHSRTLFRVQQTKLFWFIAIPSFLILIFIPWKSDQVEAFGSLKVTGHRWVRFSINGLPPRYAPTPPLVLRSGRYQLLWTTSDETRKQEIQILPGEMLLFQPENENR